MSQANPQEFEILIEAYGHLRTCVLDTIETELKDSDRWPFIRGRLLRYLGTSGFEGKLISFLKRSFHELENN